MSKKISAPTPIGRDIEIDAARGAIAVGCAVVLVGPSGFGRATVALAALDPFHPVVDRVPLYAREIPLAAVGRWIEKLSGRRARSVLSPSWPDVDGGASRSAARLLRALKKIGSRPLLLLDLDNADALSLRALEGAWLALGANAPPLMATVSNRETLSFGEAISIGPLPALACHEVLRRHGATPEEALRLAARCGGSPLLLQLAFSGRGRMDDIDNAALSKNIPLIPGLSTDEITALAAAAWGFTSKNYSRTLRKLGIPASTEPSAALVASALSRLDLSARIRLRRSMARKSVGLARAIHAAGIGDRTCAAELLRGARALLARGHAGASVELFEKAIGVEPNLVGVETDLAKAFLGAGRWPEAESILRRALEAPNARTVEARARPMLVALLRRAGRSDEARKELDLVMLRFPDNSSASNERAIFLAEDGKVREARKLFLGVLERRGASANAALRLSAAGNLGFLEARSGRSGAARRAFAVAERIASRTGQDEDLAIVFLNRSFLELQARRWSAVVANAGAAARAAGLSGLLETELRAKENLAEGLLAMGKLGDARREADHAIAIFRRLRGASDAAIWAFLVRSAALDRLGDPRGARESRSAASSLARAVNLRSVFREARSSLASSSAERVR